MISRRCFLQLTAGSAGLAIAPQVTQAQSYPSGIVRIVVGATAGGGSDLVARIIGQWMTDRLGQPFIVDNRPGAGSNLATEVVVRAPPDGQTLLLITTTNAINETLYRNLKFNFVRDIEPVAGVMQVPLVLVVNPSMPVKSVPEFIGYAKANPGKITLATGVIGGSPHVAGELFKTMTDTSMENIPYRGLSGALTDLIGGQVQALFSGLPAASEYIKSNQLRALAVTTTSRVPTHPDIPTVSEFVPGFEASQWYGIGAPRGTPSAIIEMLNKQTNASLADPELKARLAALGGIALPGPPANFRSLIVAEVEKWGRIIKLSGATAN